LHRAAQQDVAQGQAIEAPFWRGRLGGIEDVGLGLRWDAATLASEVTRRAAALHAMGIGRGSVVAIAHGASAHFFADLLATWQLRATAACLDRSLTQPELETIIGFSRPAVLLVNGAGPPGTPPLRVVDLASEPPSRLSPPPVKIDPADPALILFTSGTTGVPKGVVLSFGAIQIRLSANVEAIGTTALRRTLVTLPTHFGHGLIGNSLTPLLSGGEIVLHPPGTALMQNLGRIIDDHQITFLSSVPALWRMATRYDQPGGRSLLRVHVGSAPFAAQLWSAVAEWTRANVVNCYGLTETANWVAGASSRGGEIADGLVGEAWGTTVAVVCDDGTIRASGEGEIVVRSPAMMSGYLSRPDLTAAVLRDGWLHTGDRGVLDERGRLWLAGRIKEEINRAGIKIQPAEVDLLLERHPDVAEACVFAVPDAVSGELVAAAIKPADGAQIGPKALEAWCRERLRQEAVPERWFIVDALPRNVRGKISRDAVRRILVPACNTYGDGGATPPQGARNADDGVRNAVERAWTEAFGRESLVKNLPWDESGGDSMDTLRFWFAIEEQVGVPMSFDLLAPGATFDTLVAAIRQSQGSASADRNGAASKATPLVFFMPSLEGDMPHFARFRAAFAGRVRFEVIHYPAAPEMLGGGGFDTVVDAAVAQVRARGEAAAYCFLGVSSGGFVAWEAARCLLKAGERVEFIGLIDARRSVQPLPLRTSLVAQVCGLLTRPTSSLGDLTQRLVAKSASRRLRMLLAMGRLLPSKQSTRFRMHLGILLRRKALEDATVEPLELPATLFRTAEQWPGPHDYGWSALSRQLTIVNIEGTHVNMFEPQRLDSLRDRIAGALEAATDQMGFIRPEGVRRVG